MVANIRSGSSPGGALRYNKEKVDKDEAEVLFWQKMLEPFDKHARLDVDACMESFWPYLEANRRTTNTAFHASLNPSPEDRLTDDQLRDIAQEHMERMGYCKQPYIVFKHKDIDREHLHIVSFVLTSRAGKSAIRTNTLSPVRIAGIRPKIWNAKQQIRYFPTKDRNSMNMTIQHVARYAGFRFYPTMHLARHTFATTASLA